jgi:hypothetical protein
MEKAFIFIHSVMPIVYGLVVVLVIFKTVLVSRYKSLTFLDVFLSFFKIYISTEGLTRGRRRRKYMVYNNAINLFVYISFALFLLMLLIYKGNIFKY